MTRRQELSDTVGRALVQMLRSAEDAHERAARNRGMHPTDFRCVSFLKAQGGQSTPKDIIAYLGLTSGAGTALLNRLEAAGLIRRLPNPDDGRGYLIVLDTDAAAQAVAVYERIHERYRDATADLTDENLDAIATYLGRIQALSDELNAALYDGQQPKT